MAASYLWRKSCSGLLSLAIRAVVTDFGIKMVKLLLKVVTVTWRKKSWHGWHGELGENVLFYINTCYIRLLVILWKCVHTQLLIIIQHLLFMEATSKLLQNFSPLHTKLTSKRRSMSDAPFSNVLPKLDIAPIVKVITVTYIVEGDAPCIINS